MMMTSKLPPDVRSVLDGFRVCELATQAKDLTPIVHPLCSYLGPDGNFTMTTSIGLATKAWNIRRNPKVSMLFSEPTGSGLVNPPTVLVQGDAVAPDDVVTDIGANRDYFLQRIFRRQPDSAMMSAWLMRGMMWWYFTRIIITVEPKRIRWWPEGDMSGPPQTLDVTAGEA